MKKIALVLLILLTMMPYAFAESYDVSSMTYEELIELRKTISAELSLREADRLKESGIMAEGNVGNGLYHVTVLSCNRSVETLGANKGKPACIVKVVYTNNSNETKSFARAVDIAVFQNGVECKHGTSIEGCTNPEKLLDVLPGGSIEIVEGVLLYDEDSPLLIRVGKYLDNSSNPETFTFGCELQP